ncbi:MAG: ABC transporter ATP-binding protein [bacterium]
MKDKQTSHLQTLYKFLRKYRHYFIWGVVAVVGTSAFTTILPWILKDAIDAITNGTNAQQLLDYALMITGIAVVAGVFRFFQRRTIIWASRHIEYDLRNEFFGHLLKLSASFYQRTPTGDIIARASNDMEAVRMMVGPAVMYFINSIVSAIFVITALIVLSPKLMLYALIPLPLLSILMWQIGQQVHKRFRKIQDHFSFMSSFVQENLAGVRVIKAYLRELQQQRKFEGINEKYIDLNMSLARVRALFMPGIMFLAGTILLIVIWMGGRQVIFGTMTLGELVAFYVYLQMLIWPMIGFGFVISLYQRGSASMARIDQMLQERPDVVDPARPLAPIGKGAIKVEKLTFSFPGSDTPLLKDVSFEVQPGEKLAIVGATGSGKSTLVSLLMRRFPVPIDSIFIDGIDINQMKLDHLRSLIGFVPQESYLFSTTIEENIGFAQQTTDPDSIEHAAQLAAFDSEVESFPRGYQTLLGERGITLSGGQKQRAALARALLIKPPILVFDDSFSSVDTQTEEAILHNLAEYSGKSTILLISHRPSTIKRADKIVVLDQGTIVERGTHEELLSLQGRYWEIIRKELLASELEAWA